MSNKFAPKLGILELTFLVLGILKISKIADISWFWVFFPIMIVPALLLLLIVLSFLGIMITDSFIRVKSTIGNTNIDKKESKDEQNKSSSIS